MLTHLPSLPIAAFILPSTCTRNTSLPPISLYMQYIATKPTALASDSHKQAKQAHQQAVPASLSKCLPPSITRPRLPLAKKLDSPARKLSPPPHNNEWKLLAKTE